MRGETNVEKDKDGYIRFNFEHHSSCYCRHCSRCIYLGSFSTKLNGGK